MKRKCIFILTFILLLFLFFNISESKASFEVEYNGSIVVLPDINFKHYVVFNGHGTYYLMVLDNVYIENGYVCQGSANSFGYCKDVKTWTDSKRIAFAYYSLSSNQWNLESEESDWTIGQLSIVYSTEDIYYNNELIFEACFRVDMNYIEEENMYQVYTNFFDMSEFDNLACYISSDNLNWDNMLVGADTVNNQFKFYYNITKNGTYYVKLVYLDTSIERVISFIADKINEEAYTLNLHLSTTENTNKLYILSDEFLFSSWEDYNYEYDFTYDYTVEVLHGIDEAYKFIYPITEYNDSLTEYRSRFEYQVFSNGVYTFRITHKESGQVTYQTFNIDNYLIYNKYGEDISFNNYNENGEFDPNPVLFLDYIDTTTIRIRTQPFTFNELLYLECYVSSDGENYEKISNIYKNTIDTKKDNYTYSYDQKETTLDSYYFYYDVQVDGTYYFKFYNIDLKKYTLNSIDVNIKEFLINNVDNINEYPDRFIIWGTEHFGVLTYPFTFIINFFGRVSNINYTEPIIHIPELRDPFFNNKILDATDFNFNTVIENNVSKTIHNIYLVAVDFILIVLFIGLCKKVFSEVFDK